CKCIELTRLEVDSFFFARRRRQQIFRPVCWHGIFDKETGVHGVVLDDDRAEPQHIVAFYAVLRLGAIVVEHTPL
ncbi:hypothetical protein, partial [Clavibacter michiganensis]|uniref:hypothetical protein n=1 Tax=Clavibacter michiganensis TaxID=28447 RepID=UPI002931D72A